jgi:hypothetical protein
MANNSMWASTKSLMVVINYVNEIQLRDYRRALDAILDKSHVKKLTIIVNVPKEVDKATLPPHFLIYYNSPLDYSFMGKLKDVLLMRELEKSFDLLIWIGKLQQKVYPELKNTQFKRKVVVNDSDDSYFDLQLQTKEESPVDMLNFVTNTLDKIELYD